MSIKHKADRLAAEKAAAGQTPPPPVNVVTQTMVPMRMVDLIDLPSMVHAWDDLTVSCEAPGRITAVRVKEGDTVTKGEALIEIDKSDYKIKIRSIEAGQELAEINYNRLKNLSGQAAITQARIDEALATLKELNASLDDAKLKLKRCTIRAPMAGVVNSLPAIEGELLDHGDPVAEILKIDRLKVEVAIPEQDVSSVRDVEQCKVILAALGDREVTGKKIFLSSKPASLAMVYTLRLAIPNPSGDILPGMFARTRVVKKIFDNTYGVPLFTVITQDNEKFVYVVENETARKRPVTTGIMEGWKIQIFSGLNRGDRVIIVGHRNVEESQSVRVVRNVTDPEDVTH
ncbi:MAG: efflux RND transporter periplasmic adaptor subunit [Thermodesulfobacteriota bacterium]|nr:efflux RND transporter periplasmic adaptor subunit [Thermodesulfobacteriota bacterium]